MKHFIITPNNGIEPIKLGMHKNDVLGYFPELTCIDNNRHEAISGFFIDFEDDIVEFIELATNADFQIYYKDSRIDNMPANQLIALLETDDQYDNPGVEPGYSFDFKKLNVSLWRSGIPESEDDEDGKYIEAIGVGVSI
ncbi:MAG: hypothetical protein OCD01_14495 [Fibrobacterales bacterium]